MFRDIIKLYEEEFPDEIQRLKSIKSALDNKPEDNLLSRKNMVGHITASGIVIWRSKSKALLTHHIGLKDYFQPGGHFEKTSESPLDVAKRHVSKALKAHRFTHFPVNPDPNVPLDIDTHIIPKREEADESSHLHYDFRYLFFLDEPTTMSEANTIDKHWYNLIELSGRTTFKDLVPKILNILTESQARSYFDSVCVPLHELPRVSCLAVTHFIPDIFPYLRAVNQSFKVLGIIPKPRSINKDVEERLKKSFKICEMKREDIKTKQPLFNLLDKTEDAFILLDIGGYFSEVVNDLKVRFGGRFIGIVEDTENGHQKYEVVEKESGLSVPIISVARSPLKENEDFLVGQSILFSADFVLRQVGQLIQYLQCGILGYGKIGNSIAHHLSLRGAKPWVYDNDPIRRARAVNQLCIAPPRSHIIKNADVIFSATGKKALNIIDFRDLKCGSFVMSVTSADDELDLSMLDEYKVEKINTHIKKYSSLANFFYLVNEGNAVNFLHDAVLGDSIHLVRGEILHAAAFLLKEKPQSGITELPLKERRIIVEKWLKYFVDRRNSYMNQ